MKITYRSHYLKHEAGTKYWRIMSIEVIHDSGKSENLIVKDYGKIDSGKSRVTVSVITGSSSVAGSAYSRALNSKYSRGYEMVEKHATSTRNPKLLISGIRNHLAHNSCGKADGVTSKIATNFNFIELIEKLNGLDTPIGPEITETPSLNSASESESLIDRYSNIIGVGDFA